MRRWFERFPEYKHRQLFLAGESYAGHYIPQLATLLLKSKEFNLIGILVGNPLLNYGVDTTATYAFFWSHGVISDPSYMGVSRWCDFRYGYRGGDEEDYMEQPDAVSGEVSRVGEAVNVAGGGGGGDDSGSNKKQQQKKKGCVPFVRRAMREMGGYINIYDLSADVCVPPIHRQAVLLHQLMGLREKDRKDVCVDHEITRYLNQRAVQDALHANLTALPHPWEACSQLVLCMPFPPPNSEIPVSASTLLSRIVLVLLLFTLVNYTYIDKLEDMLPLLAHLAKEDLSIWVFSGDQDSVVPLTGTRSQITKLGRSLNLSRNAIYRPWYSHRQKMADGASLTLAPVDGFMQVGGGYESYGHGKIVYATVRGASHMVPFTQPVRALDLFSSLINGKTLPSQP
ncbi:hypothetical protein Taro_032919 [Colocasia esculenta]|uniref:Carboxypeptidase n=1 Tax=Colocasia esculenta TaxID=4460 RepID=A0A843VYM5_COLES|nr:hypothetical protein [Colocasia esculenta]